MPTAHMTREIFALFLTSGENFSTLDCDEVIVHDYNGPAFVCRPIQENPPKEKEHASDS